MTDESLEEILRRQLTIPADPETFKFAVGLFQEAASGTMHDSHIPPPSTEPGFHLKNFPLNRGMLAIVRENQHLSEDARKSLMMRVMHFGETLEIANKDSRFSDHLRIDHAGYMVSNELMDAIARTPFVIIDNQIQADLDQLAAYISDKSPT